MTRRRPHAALIARLRAVAAAEGDRAALAVYVAAAHPDFAVVDAFHGDSFDRRHRHLAVLLRRAGGVPGAEDLVE